MPILKGAATKRTGIGSEAAAAGTPVPAIWIRVQTGQFSSTARGFCLVGSDDPSGSSVTAAFASC
jgi:hypothetical protein